MAITRIKTNQITDANVTTAKIANNAITADKLANNITYGSDFAVTGNLTVSGTTTTVSTANTRIEDAILALAAEATGSATADAGILINRGNDDNQALLWDESADQFVLANVGSDVGDTSGNVDISSYAGLQAGAIVYGSLNDGTTTLTSTAAELNLVDGSTAGTILNSKAVIYGSGGEVNATKLQVGGVDISATPAEINLLDTAVAGTIVNSIAVIYGSGGEVNATKLQVGGVDISATPAEINVLDGVTAGTVLASGGVVVDSNKDIGSFRNLTATGAITGGSFVIGAADISEAELETIDGVTAGTVAASKAVVVDSNKDIAGLNDVSAAGLTLSDLTDNRITIAGTSGLLEDDANFTFDGTTLVVGASSAVFGVTVANGNTVVGGTLDVTGKTSLDGAVDLGDASGDAIAVLGTATFTPSAAFNGGFTTASGQTVTFGATNTISAGSNKITSVADPASAQDAATKAYVDSQVGADGAITDGTTSVAYGSGDTTTFSGTANETTVVVSGTSGSPVITIGLPDDVTITGNLTVSGTTTSINSTELRVDDLNIVLGLGAADSASANGGGITLDGADATITYSHSGTNGYLTSLQM